MERLESDSLTPLMVYRLVKIKIISQGCLFKGM